ncbi:MAG: cytochrome c [Albidovulum sp.]|nr:cytochrome c [Albidovulum sp.]
MKNLIAALLAVSVCTTATAWAQDDPGLEAIKARQEIMSFFGSNMRTLKAIMEGRSEFDADYVQGAGREIGAKAEELELLFPEGSEEGLNTKAKPSVFENKIGFQQELDDLKNGAAAIAVAETQIEFNAAFLSFSRTCGSCHGQFRSN